MKQNIFLMMAIIFILSGCGNKSSNKKLSPSAETQTFISLEDLKAALDEQEVICGEAGKSCPGYVAKLAFWGVSENDNSYYLGVCSGSLYQGKYIITNSHCIPKEISQRGKNCSDQIKVLFPGTKYYPDENVGCKSIVQVFDTTNEEPDIAVIELERTISRDSVEIAKNSFIEGSNVSAFTMNPQEYDKNLGVITKKMCTLSIDNALFMSTSSASGAAIISGANCEIIHGNSGSALLKGGKMIGAVYARLEGKELSKLFEKNKINYTGNVPMGIAQNITCLNTIASSSGIGCNLSSPTTSDFTDFIIRNKEQQKLTAVSDGQIEYELRAGLKLNLKESANLEEGKSLLAFKDNWTKIFFTRSEALIRIIQ